VTGAVSISDSDNHALARLAPGASRRALRPPCGLAPGRPASHAPVMPDRLTPAHRSQSRCLAAWDDAGMVRGSGAAVRLNSACGRNVAIAIWANRRN
jgi:hypothetical protein